MPTSSRPRSRASSSPSRPANPTGVPARSASCSSAACPAISECPHKAPFTPFSTATAWSPASAGVETAPREPPCRQATSPTISGASTSRASSASATPNTAIRSLSPTTPRDTCCSARRSTPSAKAPPSRPSSTCSPNAACPTPFGPTTACHSQAPTRSSTSPSSPSGGCASASPSSASGRATRSRTGDTNACTSHWKKETT